jgi:hypothetical protein
MTNAHVCLFQRRFKKARKLPGTSTESDVKQEKEYIEKVVLAKRQFEAKGDKLTDIQVLNKLRV